MPKAKVLQWLLLDINNEVRTQHQLKTVETKKPINDTVRIKPLLSTLVATRKSF